jgi:hydroxymethylpyrimidine/phosphomethylpyrimidine kinase
MTYVPTAGAAALTIAGSDSGGGAGIQADLRTFFAHGLLGATAVTAVTAQNTLGVVAWEPVSPSLVRAQIAAVLADLPIAAMKTGMLGTAAVIAAVAEALADADAKSPRPLPLVLDPVMVATSGHRLLDADAEEALKRHLLPRALVLTPNLAEAAVLSGLPRDAAPEAHAEALRTWALGAWIIIKGGHGRGPESLDFVSPPWTPPFVVGGRRVDTRATHGTGCTLSAAITAGLAQGADPEAAIRYARWYVQRAIESATPIGAGHGPLNHGFARPPLRVGDARPRDESDAA